MVTGKTPYASLGVFECWELGVCHFTANDVLYLVSICTVMHNVSSLRAVFLFPSPQKTLS